MKPLKPRMVMTWPQFLLFIAIVVFVLTWTLAAAGLLVVILFKAAFGA